MVRSRQQRKSSSESSHVWTCGSRTSARGNGSRSSEPCQVGIATRNMPPDGELELARLPAAVGVQPDVKTASKPHKTSALRPRVDKSWGRLRSMHHNPYQPVVSRDPVDCAADEYRQLLYRVGAGVNARDLAGRALRDPYGGSRNHDSGGARHRNLDPRVGGWIDPNHEIRRFAHHPDRTLTGGDGRRGSAEANRLYHLRRIRIDSRHRVIH